MTEERQEIPPQVDESSPQRGPFRGGQLVLLAGLGAIGPLGTDAYLASMPDVARSLDTTATTVQLTLTGFMIGLAVGQIVLGPLSDRYGRYRLLLAGTAMILVSSALCALAPSVELLIAARVLQGLSGAAALVLSRAIVADMASGVAAAKVFSLLGTITGIAPIAAPIIGGLIQQWADWHTVFWLLTAIGGAMTGGVLLGLRETLPAERRQRGGLGATLTTAAGIFSDRQFLGYGLSLWFGFGAMFGYISASPFVVEGILGFSPIAYSLVFAVNACGLTATAGTSAALARRVGPVRLAQAGVTIILVGAIGLAVAASIGSVAPGIILPALFLIPTGMGFILGNSTALAVAPVAHASGTAMALLGCLQFAMAGIVAPVVGLAGPRSIGPLAVVTVVCAVVALAGATVGARALRRRSPAA